jgi:transposase
LDKGEKSGAHKSLSDDQKEQIIRQLIDKNPKQLQFKFALWTREAVKHLVKHKLNIDMPISTVGHYLKKWQFTSRKPIKRAYERKDEKTQKWLNEEYPQIKIQAKEENAVKYMNELSTNQEKVASFFKHPSIAYAAA